MTTSTRRLARISGRHRDLPGLIARKTTRVLGHVFSGGRSGGL
jgi:hypothetical protein